MCAYIIYGLLGGLAAYILVTVMAFAYLPWWQAVLASAGFFVVEVLIGRYLVKRFFRRIATLAQGAFDVYGKVMQGAAVDVHHVRAPGDGATPMLLAAGESASNTYHVEFTLFPPDSSADWEPSNLVFTPDGKPDDEADDAEVRELEVIDGDADGTVTGARRIQAVLEVPAGVTKLTIRYGLADVGMIDLTKLTPTTGREL